MDKTDEFLVPWAHELFPEPTTVDFERIAYDTEGVQVVLSERHGLKRIFALHFKEAPAAIRIVNESQRIASLGLRPKNSKHSFYLVKNSTFLKWLNQESLDIYRNDHWFHFVILTDEWIDLICDKFPVISTK
jgi:hypothetical protein